MRSVSDFALRRPVRWSETLLDQVVDRILVDDHGLLDLDLLVVDVDDGLPEPWDLDAVDDWRAAEHQLGDRHHGVAGIAGVPEVAFANGAIHDQWLGLRRHHGADHGNLLT